MRATLALAPELLAATHDLGFPAALAAQDRLGLGELEVPFDSFGALFIGGPTRWRLSPEAAVLMGEVQRRGNWVHVGRVNALGLGHLRRFSGFTCQGFSGGALGGLYGKAPTGTDSAG